MTRTAPMATLPASPVGGLRTAEIVGRRVAAVDIVAIDLADPEGAALPNFAAGAHIDVEFQPGLMRQYSLYALPDERGLYRIAVLKDPASRGGSAALHALGVGEHVRISAPRNHFALAEGPHHTLLLAGGIGVTPLLCMAEQLHRAGRSFTLHYCTRTESRAAFVDLLQGAPYAGQTNLHYDDGSPAQKLDIDAALAACDADTQLYVCGPTGFMAWVIDAAARAGWPESCVHREYFGAAPSVPAAGDAEFQVRLARSGRLFDIPADRAIISVLHEAGVDLPVSCGSGVCGTCLCIVLEGTPDHRDYFLTPEERARGDQMLPCCSRATSKLLVLDL